MIAGWKAKATENAHGVMRDTPLSTACTRLTSGTKAAVQHCTLTHGLPSAARLSTNPSVNLRGFAASRETSSLQGNAATQ